MATCEICETPTSGSLEFCREHYRQWKDDIKGKAPWVRILKNDAQRERRRREKEFNNQSLDQMLERQEQGFSHNQTMK